MLSQLTEQVKKSAQPASDLFAANLKVLQAISKQQTELMSGVLGDSMKLMSSVGEQTDVKGVLAAQGVYAESLRERLTASSKTTFGTLSTAGQQFADSMKASFDLSAYTAASTPAKTPVKKIGVNKASVKKATAKTSTTAVKAAATTEKKVTSVKKSATKKSSAATKAAAAPVTVEAEKATINVKPITQKVVKPLPTLSADNVRATPKQAVVDTVSETPTKQNDTSEA